MALASVVHVFVLRTFGADDPREASALQVTPQLSGSVLEAAAIVLVMGGVLWSMRQHGTPRELAKPVHS